MRIAIVEDDASSAMLLESFIAEYSKNAKESFAAKTFGDSGSFLKHCESSDTDIVFMDINLPDGDGMAASKQIRKTNKDMVIVFVTDMAQFAIKGYEVDALDFIVKPVTYHNFSLVLERAIRRVVKTSALSISIKVDDGFVRLASSDIRYIEIDNHKLIYHTVDGTFTTYGQLKDVEKGLSKAGFIKCSRFYLVNIKHVKSIRNYTMDVGGDLIYISLRKRKEVLAAMADFFGEGGEG